MTYDPSNCRYCRRYGKACGRDHSAPASEPQQGMKYDAFKVGTTYQTVTAIPEEGDHRVTVTTYWHRTEDGREPYIVVDIDTSEFPSMTDDDGVPNRLKVTVNDGTVYSHQYIDIREV